MDREYSNDYELLYMIYQMDEYSLKEFVRKYQGIIRKHVDQYYWGTNITLYKEDIILEGIQVLMSSIYAYRDDQQTLFSTYYHCILKNRLATFYRMYYRDRAAFQGELLELDRIVEDTNSYHVDHLVNHDISLEGRYYLYMADYRDILAKLMRELQPKEQEIIMARIHGYSYEEIARRLKVDVKKVDNTLVKVRNIKV